MSSEDEETPGKTIKSVETAFRILEALRDGERMGVTELADALDISKSTVHHHVNTLANENYLEREEGTYELGLGMLTFGGTARSREQIFALAREDVDRLAEETGELVRLVAEWDSHGVILYQSAGGNVDGETTHVGSVHELHCTAAGKAFLAELPAECWDELLDVDALTGYTENTITDPDELEAELDRVEMQGIAFDDEEYHDGIRCVASAISDHSGELLGAISVSGPTDRIDDDRFRSEIPHQIRNTVGVVEINTTYSQWIEQSSR